MACGELVKELLVGLPQVPSLVEDVLIGHLLHFEAFEGRADAHQVLAALFEGSLEFLARLLHIALNGRVAAKVAQVAPNVGLPEETVQVAPHLFELAVVVEHSHLALRHTGEHGTGALGGVVLALVVEEPAHLQPFGLGVHRFEAFVDVFRYLVEVLGLKTRRVHLVEWVNAINVVGAEEFGLLFNEEFLNFGIERILAVEEEGAVLWLELVPSAQRLDVGIGEEGAELTRHMPCESR